MMWSAVLLVPLLVASAAAEGYGADKAGPEPAPTAPPYDATPAPVDATEAPEEATAAPEEVTAAAPEATDAPEVVAATEAAVVTTTEAAVEATEAATEAPAEEVEEGTAAPEIPAGTEAPEGTEAPAGTEAPVTTEEGTAAPAAGGYGAEEGVKAPPADPEPAVAPIDVSDPEGYRRFGKRWAALKRVDWNMVREEDVNLRFIRSCADKHRHCRFWATFQAGDQNPKTGRVFQVTTFILKYNAQI